MLKTTVLILVGIVCVHYANVGEAIPLEEDSPNLMDNFQEENNWKREERGAIDSESSEQDNSEEHDIEKRTNPFRQHSGNAEENVANQLFSKAYKIHNPNVEADSPSSDMNSETGEANHSSDSEINNKDEVGKSDSGMEDVTHNSIFGDEKPINRIEKASDENAVENSNLARANYNVDSPIAEKFEQSSNDDGSKVDNYESRHTKRCGIHKPKPALRDQQPKAQIGCEDSEKYKQNSTKIAMQAAKAAKLASDSQKCAAEHAARIVKTQLSEQAQQASQKAQAVLAGKESYVAEIECQIHEAEELYKDMRCSMEHIRRNVEAASASRQDASEDVEALQIAVKIAKKNVCDAEAVVEGSEEVVVERETLLHSAKRRLQTLLNQLKAARCDYRNTKLLAQKAACAAAEAKANAARNRRKLDFKDT